MDHHVDITIKPDAEMRENFLLNKVYTKLHKALSDANATDVGVSFPQWKIKLGRILRIHGNKERLVALQNGDWLGGLIGYCEISQITPIPDQVMYRVISRVQPNMSPSKLRRLQRRGSIVKSELRSYKTKMFSCGIDNPYLELESVSSGKLYRRYIEFGELLDKPANGTFDHFGLSKTATIPWF